MYKIETFISGLNSQVLKNNKIKHHRSGAAYCEECAKLQTEFVLPQTEVTKEKSDFKTLVVKSI
jgi:hypothetical protein